MDTKFAHQLVAGETLYDKSGYPFKVQAVTISAGYVTLDLVNEWGFSQVGPVKIANNQMVQYSAQ